MKITLDWDSYNEEPHEHMRLRAILTNPVIYSIQVRKSTHGGTHVWLEVPSVRSNDTAFKFREMYWDDSERLRLDKQRGNGTGVLFDRKGMKRMGTWRWQECGPWTRLK